MKIIIQDNGVGMKKSQTYSSESEKHIHMGIEMTRRRLELLGMKYSVDTSIDFYEASSGLPNPGTRIVLVVPVSFGESEL
jgi:nitrate/nitrite-specific signal transduction histidine kinase